jgi:hypothetical protein
MEVTPPTSTIGLSGHSCVLKVNMLKNGTELDVFSVYFGVNRSLSEFALSVWGVGLCAYQGAYDAVSACTCISSRTQ